MKHLFFFLLVLLFVICTTANAQENPIHWDASIKKLDKNTYELRLKANADEGWHIYSQHTTEGGPLPTKVSISDNPVLTVEQEVKEVGDKLTKFEPLFKVNVMYYNKQLELVTKITRKIKVKTMLSGQVEYMTCNDTKCLPSKTFSFNLKVD